MLDIIENYLNIKNMMNVIKNNIPPNERMYKNGRLSDGFIYILTGKCDYKTEDGEAFTASAGDLLYLSHNAKYAMEIGEELYSFIFCNFFFDSDEQRKCAVYKIEKTSGLEDIFVKLYERFLLKTNASQSECMALLYQIYAIALKHSKQYIGNSKREKMELAQRWMQEDFTLTVQEIAKKLGITEVYFRKLFQAAYNVSPSQYMIYARIERAKNLMETSGFSMEDCALQSGFSSVQYFNRAFKKVTGFTPATYRKLKQIVMP